MGFIKDHNIIRLTCYSGNDFLDEEESSQYLLCGYKTAIYTNICLSILKLSGTCFHDKWSDIFSFNFFGKVIF